MPHRHADTPTVTTPASACGRGGSFRTGGDRMPTIGRSDHSPHRAVFARRLWTCKNRATDAPRVAAQPQQTLLPSLTARTSAKRTGAPPGGTLACIAPLAYGASEPRPGPSQNPFPVAWASRPWVPRSSCLWPLPAEPHGLERVLRAIKLHLPAGQGRDAPATHGRDARATTSRWPGMRKAFRLTRAASDVECKRRTARRVAVERSRGQRPGLCRMGSDCCWGHPRSVALPPHNRTHGPAGPLPPPEAGRLP